MTAALTEEMMKYFSADEGTYIDDRLRNTLISIFKRFDHKMSQVEDLITKITKGDSLRVMVSYGKKDIYLYISIPKTNVDADDIAKAFVVDAIVEARSRYYFASLIMLTIALIILSDIVIPTSAILAIIAGIGILLIVLAFILIKRAPKQIASQKIDRLHKHMLISNSLYRLFYERVKLVIHNLLEVWKDVRKGKKQGYTVFENYGLFSYIVKRQEDDTVEIKFSKVKPH